MKKEIIVFGASLAAENTRPLLENEYNIIAYSDNDKSKWGKAFLNRKIIPPYRLLEFPNVPIIIVNKYYAAINRQLKKMGISEVYVCFRDYKKKTYELIGLPEKPLFQDCTLHHDVIGVHSEVGVRSNTLRHVLLCAYYYPPIGGSGVQRALKYSKYLVKLGYRVTVLTVGKYNEDVYAKDESLLNEIPEAVEIIRVDNPSRTPEDMCINLQQKIFDAYAQVIEEDEWFEALKKEYTVGGIRGRLLLPDQQMAWAVNCVDFLKGKCDINDYDIVFTTGNPFSVFFIGYLLRIQYGIRWAMDYRDPWVTNDWVNNDYWQYSEQDVRLLHPMEKKMVETADLITVAGDAIKADIEDRYIKRRANNIIVITNGYDESDFPKTIIMKKNNVFTLSYNGLISADRHPQAVVIAINLLIEAGEVERSQVTFQIVGDISNEIKRDLEKVDKYSVINFIGYLPHKESIIKVMGSDMLILFGGPGEKGKSVYTGKVFEYLRMRRKILCFSSKGSVLDGLLQSTRTGVVVEYEDVESTKKALLSQYTKWKDGNDSEVGDLGEIEKYSRENLAKRLANAFDSLFEDQK